MEKLKALFFVGLLLNAWFCASSSLPASHFSSERGVTFITGENLRNQENYHTKSNFLNSLSVSSSFRDFASLSTSSEDNSESPRSTSIRSLTSSLVPSSIDREDGIDDNIKIESNILPMIAFPTPTTTSSTFSDSTSSITQPAYGTRVRSKSVVRSSINPYRTTIERGLAYPAGASPIKAIIPTFKPTTTTTLPTRRSPRPEVELLQYSSPLSNHTQNDLKLWYETIFKNAHTLKKLKSKQNSAFEIESENMKNNAKYHKENEKDEDDEFGVDFAKSPHVDQNLSGVTHLNLTKNNRDPQIEILATSSINEDLNQVQSIKHETKVDSSILGIGNYQSSALSNLNLSQVFGDYKSPDLSVNPFEKNEDSNNDSLEMFNNSLNNEHETGFIYETDSPDTDSKLEFVSLNNFKSTPDSQSSPERMIYNNVDISSQSLSSSLPQSSTSSQSLSPSSQPQSSGYTRSFSAPFTSSLSSDVYSQVFKNTSGSSSSPPSSYSPLSSFLSISSPSSLSSSNENQFENSYESNDENLSSQTLLNSSSSAQSTGSMPSSILPLYDSFKSLKTNSKPTTYSLVSLPPLSSSSSSFVSKIPNFLSNTYSRNNSSSIVTYPFYVSKSISEQSSPSSSSSFSPPDSSSSLSSPSFSSSSFSPPDSSLTDEVSLYFSCVYTSSQSASSTNISTNKSKSNKNTTLSPDQIVYSFVEQAKHSKDTPKEPEYGFYGVYDTIDPNPYEHIKSLGYGTKPYGSILQSDQPSTASVSSDTSKWNAFRAIPSKYLSKSNTETLPESDDSLTKWRGISDFQNTPPATLSSYKNPLHPSHRQNNYQNNIVSSNSSQDEAFPYETANPNEIDLKKMIRLIPKATIEEIPLPPMSEYNEPDVITDGNYVVKVEKIPLKDRYDAYYNPEIPDETLPDSSNRQNRKANEEPKSSNQEKSDKGEDKNSSEEDVEEEKSDDEKKTETETETETETKKEDTSDEDMKDDSGEKKQPKDSEEEDETSTTTTSTTTEAPEADNSDDDNKKENEDKKPTNPHGFPLPPLPPFPFYFPPLLPPYGYPPMPFFPPYPPPPYPANPPSYRHKPVTLSDEEDLPYRSTTPSPPKYKPKFYGPVTTQVELNANMEKAISINTRQPYDYNGYENRNGQYSGYSKPEYSSQNQYKPPKSYPSYQPPQEGYSHGALHQNYAPPSYESHHSPSRSSFPSPSSDYTPKVHYPRHHDDENAISHYKRNGYSSGDKQTVNIDTNIAVTPSAYSKRQSSYSAGNGITYSHQTSPPPLPPPSGPVKGSGFYNKIKQSLKNLMPRLRYGSGDAYPPKLDSNYQSIYRNDQNIPWNLGESETPPNPRQLIVNCGSNRIGKCVVDRTQLQQYYTNQPIDNYATRA